MESEPGQANAADGENPVARTVDRDSALAAPLS
jgi:hypothetical protein